MYKIVDVCVRGDSVPSIQFQKSLITNMDA
jgi:hypothetical protein